MKMELVRVYCVQLEYGSFQCKNLLKIIRITDSVLLTTITDKNISVNRYMIVTQMYNIEKILALSNPITCKNNKVDIKFQGKDISLLWSATILEFHYINCFI